MSNSHEIMVINEHHNSGAIRVVLEPNTNRAPSGRDVLTIRRRYCRGCSNTLSTPYIRESWFAKSDRPFEIKIIIDKKRTIIERISSSEGALYMSIHSTIPVCCIITMLAE